MKITSLRDLPRDVAPPRDLWPQIAAQITPSAQTLDFPCKGCNVRTLRGSKPVFDEGLRLGALSYPGQIEVGKFPKVLRPNNQVGSNIAESAVLSLARPDLTHHHS